jgi:Icc protein
MTAALNRRDLLKSAAVLAAGAALSGAPLSAWASGARGTGRRRVLRVAHLTDLHIQPERRAAEGVAACLAHVQSQADPPDMILFGGDLVMDSFEQNDARTKLQWDLFIRAVKNGCSLPVRHCIGNHDIWGWNKKKSGTTGGEALWGKRRAMDLLGLDKPYYSFDRAGWHFVVLDSVQPDGDGYVGRLDDEQFDWLGRDLAAAAGTPTLVLSHISILTATVVLDEPKKGTTTREVSSSLLLADSGRVRDLFAAHPGVKLALSGHMHRIDRVDHRGVSYLCNGAVSGNWWKGAHYECNEGYALIDLHDDGTFESRYVNYGWRA